MTFLSHTSKALQLAGAVCLCQLGGHTGRRQSAPGVAATVEAFQIQLGSNGSGRPDKVLPALQPVSEEQKREMKETMKRLRMLADYKKEHGLEGKSEEEIKKHFEQREEQIEKIKALQTRQKELAEDNLEQQKVLEDLKQQKEEQKQKLKKLDQENIDEVLQIVKKESEQKKQTGEKLKKETRDILMKTLDDGLFVKDPESGENKESREKVIQLLVDGQKGKPTDLGQKYCDVHKRLYFGWFVGESPLYDHMIHARPIRVLCDPEYLRDGIMDNVELKDLHSEPERSLDMYLSALKFYNSLPDAEKPYEYTQLEDRYNALTSEQQQALESDQQLPQAPQAAKKDEKKDDKSDTEEPKSDLCWLWILLGCLGNPGFIIFYFVFLRKQDGEQSENESAEV
jgi:hypothetical protein